MLAWGWAAALALTISPIDKGGNVWSQFVGC